jgi:hypothetical protein
LNKADLPTFGRPTIPQLKPMMFHTQNAMADRPDQVRGPAMPLYLWPPAPEFQGQARLANR